MEKYKSKLEIRGYYLRSINMHFTEISSLYLETIIVRTKECINSIQIKYFHQNIAMLLSQHSANSVRSTYLITIAVFLQRNVNPNLDSGSKTYLCSFPSFITDYSGCLICNQCPIYVAKRKGVTWNYLDDIRKDM